MNRAVNMNCMTVLVREARISDLSCMVLLLKELFSIEEDFEFDEDLQTRGLMLLVQEKNLCCVLVAESEERIIGMCTMQILISTAEGGCVGVIEDLVVAKEFRAQGVGKALLLNMQEKAKEQGLSRLQLLADRKNQQAIGFYGKMEWTQTQLFCLRKKF